VKQKLHIPSGSNIVAFVFSCFFVVYGLWNISDTLWIKLVMAGLGLYVEYEAQYIWGLSFAYKRVGRRSAWLKMIYISYVIVFALLTAVGFFATEINAQETVSGKIEAVETNNQNRIGQLNALIDDLQIQIKKEGRSGAREYYWRLQTKIDTYNDELKELLKQSKNQVAEQSKPVLKDMFKNLSKTLWDIPKNFLILLMFGLALSLVYIGLMLNPWEITLEEESKTSQKVSEEVPETLPDSKRELLTVIDALFKGKKDGLNGVDKVAEITGMDRERCIELRNYLNRLKMGDDTAITIRQGGATPNYSKEEIVERVLNA